MGFTHGHPFPLLPSVQLLVVLPISRSSRRLFLGVRGSLDYAGPVNPLAISVVVVLPSYTPSKITPLTSGSLCRL